MKRKFLLTAVALLCAVGMWAQDEGTYYIQNVSTGKWLGPGNSWGTQASVLDHADYWKLAKKSDGVYTLESVVSNGGTSYYLNGTYCDGSATNFTFTAVGGKENTYTIANGSGDFLTVSGNIVNVSGSDASAEVSQWKLWSASDMSAGMAAATSVSPFDATYLIKDHDLGRNNRDYSSWSNTDATAPKTSDKPVVAGSVYSIEAFQKTFEVKQTLSSVPNGRYALRVNGFYRQDGSGNLPYLYAGSTEVTLPVRTGTENDMQAAAESFVAGNYLSDPATTLVTNNSLTVGVKTTGTSCWVIFKNFHLEYYGNAISYYSPTEFTSGNSASAGDWKYYDVNDGWYKIASNAEITFYYSQDNNEDAESTKSVAISEGGYTYLNLSEGKLYFKSSADATLTLTEGFVTNDDITALFLTNPNFTGNADGWQGNPSYKSNNAEKFNTTFEVYQTASNLPAGYYWIKAQAFDRETDNTATYESASSVSKAYLYAGNASILVKRIYDDASATQKNSGTDELSFTKNATTVYIPNKPAAGGKYFDAGLYDNELLIYHTGGDLRIGIKKYVKTSNDWCLFDNFRIISAGSTPSNETDMTSLITNPSFETGDNTGWSTDAGIYIQNGSDLSNKVGTYYEMLQGKTTHRNASQTVSSPVPAGKYILSVNAKANSDAGDVTINMGGNSTPIPSGVDASIYTVAYETAESASPEIKFQASNGSGDLRRCYFDNFTLTYYSTLPDVSISDLTSKAMDASVRTALTTASTTYNGSKTAANYNALQTAIINAKNSIAKYGTSENSDWTGLITNPSFEQGGTVSTAPGWSLRGGNCTSTNGNDAMKDNDGDHYLSYWTNSTTGSEVYQTISNLPAGSYKLSADVNTDVNTTLTLKAGSVKNATVATSTSRIPMEVYFTLAEMSSIEIGVGTLTDRGNGGVWYAMDHFQLTFNPTLPESGTQTAVSGAMNSVVNNAQTTAISTYDAEDGQTMANMLAVQSAKYAAIQSFVIYEKIATIRNTYSSKSEGLDAAGQSAYSTAINRTTDGAAWKYTNGIYETAAQAESAFHADYVTAVKAQTTAGSDMTDAIKNPSFDTKDANGWTITETSHGNQQYGSLTAESWNNNNVTYSQELLDLHPGIYRLTAQVDNGRDNSNVTLFASYGENTPISTLATYRAISSYASASSDLISDKSLCLKTVLINIEGEENQTLTIGVKDVSTGNGWMIFDNFHLTYVGASLPASMEKVTGLMYAGAKDDSDDAVDAYESAYATYNSDKTQSNYDAAFSAFEAAQAAIALAEVSKATYASVTSSTLEAYKARMAELLAATNVYTEAAYNKWYADVEANYAAGVYTDAEVVTLTAAGACQGATETSHQKANRIDDVLLSTWTIGGEQCSDYSKSLYINTWSTEGNSDGSNFQTPFFEYWTSDGNSLTAATMISTMTNLDANRDYSLDIWARVRERNGQTKAADKITIQLSNGSVVDLAAGTQVGSTQFYLKHFRAYGRTDGSGELTITVSVADGSNVSWLAFKDLMLKPKAEVTVSAKAGKYGTVIFPFTPDVSTGFDGITFYTIDEISGSTLTLSEPVVSPAANTPYIIKNDNGSDFSLPLSNWDVAEEDSYTVGMLTGVFKASTIAASVEPTASDAGAYRYVLQTQEGVQAFYKVNADFRSAAYKCYLTVPVAATGGDVKAFFIGFADPDGIETIGNGQLTIDNDKVIYNLAGQRLSKAQKGVNIINGKKVLVK